MPLLRRPARKHNKSSAPGVATIMLSGPGPGAASFS